MARIENQTVSLTLPGTLEIKLVAHFDIEIEGDRRTGEMAYTIHLGYVEWTLAGHKMYDIEGREIPQDMINAILAKITVTAEEMSDALKDADDEDVHYRMHAAGAF